MQQQDPVAVGSPHTDAQRLEVGRHRVRLGAQFVLRACERAEHALELVAVLVGPQEGMSSDLPARPTMPVDQTASLGVDPLQADMGRLRLVTVLLRPHVVQRAAVLT